MAFLSAAGFCCVVLLCDVWAQLGSDVGEVNVLLCGEAKAHSDAVVIDDCKTQTQAKNPKAVSSHPG